MTSLGAPIKTHAFETRRLAWLYRNYAIAPTLDWRLKSLGSLGDRRKDKGEVTLAVHLKHVAPYKLEESNADEKVWKRALSLMLKEFPIKIVYIGNDKAIDHVKSLTNDRVLTLSHLPIEDQLRAASQLDGFIGLASGIASFAMYSEIPFHLYKHPAHHAEAMVKEFGDTYEIPFWRANQVMHRTEVTVERVLNDVDCLLKSL